MTEHICPHCGNDYPHKANVVVHSKICLDNPVVLANLRDFILAHATNGKMPTVEYYRRHGPQDLPGYKTIMDDDRIQRWGQLPAFLGIDLKANVVSLTAVCDTQTARPPTGGTGTGGANKPTGYYRRKTAEGHAEVDEMERRQAAHEQAEEEAQHSLATNGWKRKRIWNPNRHCWEWVRSAEVI